MPDTPRDMSTKADVPLGRKKDLHVCVVLEGHALVRIGGAEYQAHQLAEELNRRADVTVTYVARGVPRTECVPYDVHRMGYTTGFRRRSVAFDARELWRTLLDLQPDVIYQRMKQSYTAVCAHYARRAGIPLVFHAAADPDTDGRWLRKRLSPNAPFDLLDVAAGNWGVRHATHVVVQTEKQAELLRGRFDRDASAIIKNFQPLPDTLPDKRPDGLRVLWVGNIREMKRPRLFLDLAESLSKHPGIEFWMVGRPAGQRNMQSTMADIRRSKHVHYFGELRLDAVNTLMSEADVFVNTSSFEGFPNTFIQAWAHGAIVTSLDVDIDGGLDASGIGFRTHQVPRLAQVITKLHQDPCLRREMSAKAFEYVKREHSVKNLVCLANFVIGTARKKTSSQCP